MRDRNLTIYAICAIIFCAINVLVFILSSLIFQEHKPIIYFPNGNFHDWGIVEEGHNVKHSFLFENRGDDTLKILKVITTCSCSSAMPEKKALAPGETSEITVGYTGRRVPIDKKEAIETLVITNDPDKPHVSLLLTCKVHSKVFWFPQSVSIYCDNDKEKEKQVREVQLVTDQTEEFSIKDIETSSDKISSCCEKNDKGFICRIELDPNCPKGNWTEKVKIDIVTKNNYSRSIHIPTYLMIR